MPELVFATWIGQNDGHVVSVHLKGSKSPNKPLASVYFNFDAAKPPCVAWNDTDMPNSQLIDRAVNELKIHGLA